MQCTDTGLRSHPTQIYNEMIRDLLNPLSGILDLREDSSGAVVVAGLLEVETTSTQEVMGLLSQGNQRRTCEPTAVNKTSSRSHAILKVCGQTDLPLTIAVSATFGGQSYRLFIHIPSDHHLLLHCMIPLRTWFDSRDRSN